MIFYFAYQHLLSLSLVHILMMKKIQQYKKTVFKSISACRFRGFQDFFHFISLQNYVHEQDSGCIEEAQSNLHKSASVMGKNDRK
jgi:hypothetical protein